MALLQLIEVNKGESRGVTLCTTGVFKALECMEQVDARIVVFGRFRVMKRYSGVIRKVRKSEFRRRNLFPQTTRRAPSGAEVAS